MYDDGGCTGWAPRRRIPIHRLRRSRIQATRCRPLLRRFRLRFLRTGMSYLRCVGKRPRFFLRDVWIRRRVSSLWLDTFLLWGHPLLVCKAVTLERNRRILGFVENGLRDASLVEELFRDFLDRGFDLPPGLLCITLKAKHLSQVLPAALTAPIKWQQCQVHTHEHMISYLCESDRVRIRGTPHHFSCNSAFSMSAQSAYNLIKTSMMIARKSVLDCI